MAGARSTLVLAAGAALVVAVSLGPLGAVGLGVVVRAAFADLDRSPCVDSHDALIRAASRGDRDGVVEALRPGAEVDRQVDGWTALACASSAREVEIVDLLLGEGAAPSPEVLQAAVGARSPSGLVGSAPDLAPLPTDDALLEIVGALLEAGADPNGGDHGPSPLLYAAWSGQGETSDLLLAHGADADHGGRVSSALVELAQTFSAGTTTGTDPRGISQLLPDTRAATVENVPPLVGAAWSGEIEIARRLLDAGADPDLASDEAFTAMFAAAVRGDADMVDLLLSRGAAAVPAVRAGVRTPAEAARDAGHPDIAELLAGVSPGHA
jgi:ankyrin repeat protein